METYPEAEWIRRLTEALRALGVEGEPALFLELGASLYKQDGHLSPEEVARVNRYDIASALHSMYAMSLPPGTIYNVLPPGRPSENTEADDPMVWASPLIVPDRAQWELWFLKECFRRDVQRPKAVLEALAREISAYRRHELPSEVAEEAERGDGLTRTQRQAWFSAVQASCESQAPGQSDSEDRYMFAQMAWDAHPQLRGMDPYEAVRILEAEAAAKDLLRSHRLKR